MVSPDQCGRIRAMRRSGASLREIVDRTPLGYRVVQEVWWATLRHESDEAAARHANYVIRAIEVKTALVNGRALDFPSSPNFRRF
jgi:hypothetical protein